MMDARKLIQLDSIEYAAYNTLVYHCRIGEDLQRFLAPEPLWVRYETPIDEIPPGIAAIPFVGLMAPLVWFYGGTVVVPELDSQYAQGMDQVLAVFAELYPSLQLTGRLQVARRTDCAGSTDALRRCQFFTGGIDSMATVLTHQADHPLLVSIWGADVRLRQEAIWRRIDREQAELAQSLGLRRTVMVSNYFDLLQLWALDVYFPGKLLRGWYVEVAYGSIFLGLLAPLAWREGIGTVFFASSFGEADHALDGSHPLLVEKIVWPGCRVCYDGIQEDRQAKTTRLSQSFLRQRPGLKLVICAKPVEAGNCSLCEKCSRTMAGLALNGIDPVNHGFTVSPETPLRIRHSLEHSEWELPFPTFWREIQLQAAQGMDLALPHWQEFFAWLVVADLAQLVHNRPRPLWENERRIIKSHLPVALMIWLRKWKMRLLGRCS